MAKEKMTKGQTTIYNLKPGVSVGAPGKFQMQ
jgi:hypothetical protein